MQMITFTMPIMSFDKSTQPFRKLRNIVDNYNHTVHSINDVIHSGKKNIMTIVNGLILNAGDKIPNADGIFLDVSTI